MAKDTKSQGAQQQATQQQATQTASDATQDTQATQDATPIEFESWIAEQPEAVKTAFEGHTSGLRKALQAEREEKKTLAKQLRDAAKAMEEGSESRKAVEELGGKLDAANRRADFFEEATDPKVGCSSVKLAWLAANELGAIDGRGRVDWDALKAQFPELFLKKQTLPTANAGSGTGQQPPAGGGMNTFIRKAAGK
jgi:hypothetical protein